MKALVVILFLASLVAALATVAATVVGRDPDFAGRQSAGLLLTWVAIAAGIALMDGGDE